MKSFVIVVDMQWDFVAPDGALSVTGADALVAPMQAWLTALEPAAVAGVLFTADTHVAEVYAQSEEAKQFPLHCERGTPGWMTVLDRAALAPGIACYALEKGVFDMWAEPGLSVEPCDGSAAIDRELFFAQLRTTGVEAVTVVGVAADYCVRWAVEGLIARGFRVTVPCDLTRGIAREIDVVATQEWPRAAVTLDAARA